MFGESCRINRYFLVFSVWSISVGVQISLLVSRLVSGMALWVSGVVKLFFYRLVIRFSQTMEALQMYRKWSLFDIPNLSGKVAIVTGGNVGLGFKTSLELARKGVAVTIACRSVEKGEEAAKKIKSEISEADVSVLSLDLINSNSIEKFSQDFSSKNNKLDLLINNAGVVNLENHQLTPEGQEMHMATNHLGHFSLTGKLFPLLTKTDDARVVLVSSLAYRQGVIDFSDFSWNHRKYDRMKCYGDSKLANMLFMHSLNGKFKSLGSTAIAVAAHPGLTGTERQQSIGIGGLVAKWVASPVEKGCLPQLLAACEATAKAGEFYGPKFGLIGRPVLQKLHSKALDYSLAKALWAKSEEITGVQY